MHQYEMGAILYRYRIGSIWQNGDNVQPIKQFGMGPLGWSQESICLVIQDPDICSVTAATQSFQEVTGSSVSAIKPVIAITASIVAAAAYSLS